MNRPLAKFLLLLLFFSASSCTKSIPQLIEERNILAERDYYWLYNRLGNPDTIELTIDEAIEFALEHNLDLRVQEAQIEVAGDAIGKALIQMLPNLTISTLYAKRNNLPLATSQFVNNVFPLPPPSFGALETTEFWNVELGWNILNTGIQYFVAREAKNSQLALEFMYVTAAHNLISQVVNNYWLTAIMEESERKIEELSVISRDLAKKLHKEVDEGYISLEKATDLIGRIYYQQVQAKLYLRSYQGAREQLLALLGIPPTVKVILKAPKEKILPGALPLPSELHKIALTHRPELYQIDVNLAIHEDELRAAILQIFPFITPFIDFTADYNPFLSFNYWVTIGFRTLYDLLAIPLSFNSQMTAEDQMCVSRAQRVALSLTILSQIHISYALYKDARDRFNDAKIYWEAKRNSYELALAKKNLNAIGDLDYVFPLSDLGYAETQMNLFYVEMLGYLEQLSNSIGIPRFFTEHFGTRCSLSEEKQP